MKSKELTRRILHWFNNNRETIQKYKRQYIAYDDQEVLVHGTELHQILKSAQSLKKPFAIYFVPDHSASIVIYPIRLRSVSRHEWLPNCLVSLKHRDTELPATMLVDSGADFSVISKKLGEELGFALADGEQMLLAHGVGGNVNYVLRHMQMTIESYSFDAPVAWLQEAGHDEEILGREKVFDLFNIEFRQADEEIIFTWRQ